VRLRSSQQLLLPLQWLGSGQNSNNPILAKIAEQLKVSTVYQVFAQTVAPSTDGALHMDVFHTPHSNARRGRRASGKATEMGPYFYD